MAKFAVVCETCTSILEVNGTQHLVSFRALLVDSTIGFNNHIPCEALIDASDNSNKVKDAYVQGVVEGAALVGSTIAPNDVISHQFFRAP